MFDTDEECTVNANWQITQKFNLPADTKDVTIKGNNSESVGGILASFSNGVVTDGTWQCADMSLCTTTKCENSVTWQDAETYGVNANHKIWRTRSNIDSTAQWIWVVNRLAKRVWCKKTFGKSIMYLKMPRSYLYSSV